MTPAARISASIELLDEILSSWRHRPAPPADNLIGSYFKQRRFIGSKDRGDLAQRVYFILRYYASLTWWIEQAGFEPNARLLVIAEQILKQKLNENELKMLFTGADYAAKPLQKEEMEIIRTLSGKELFSKGMKAAQRLNYPYWIEPYLKEVFGDQLQEEMEALNREAPVDLRTNTLKTTRDALLKRLREEGFDPEVTEHTPWSIRLQKRGAIFASPAFREGWFEVQDVSSQRAALLTDAKSGEKIIDFCAGAGGKTLAMAAMMKNKGRILAWDISESRLNQMKVRLKRAGVDNVQLHPLSSETDPFIKRHKDSADKVLVDAPCTGMGTWRRNPDMKWRTQPSDLEELTAIQAKILTSASRLVKPGGRLIYATCSLLINEDEKQVEAFLHQHPNFKVVRPELLWNKDSKLGEFSEDFLRTTPHKDGGDGFFAALLERVG